MKVEGKTRAQIFGENLERLRKEKGYSRKQLADVVGIKETSLGQYSRGESLAPLDKIFELAEFLNVSILDLTGENPNIKPKDKIFDYRYKKAMDIAKMLFDFPPPAVDSKGYVTIYVPNQVEHEDDGTVTFKGAVRPLRFKSAKDFVTVMELAESQALYQSFVEAFKKIVFKE